MRDFWILWVSQTVNELGTRMSTFVFPLLGYALTGSIALAGLVEAAHLLGLVACLLPAGVLADRVDRGRIMRGAALLGALAYGTAAAAALLGALTFAHLLMTALASGIAAGLLAPAETAAIRAVVPAERLPEALSLNQGRQHVAGLVGGPLGGAIYAVARWLPLLADAVSYLAAAVLLRGLRSDLSAPPRSGRSAVGEIRDGVAHLVRHPLFRVLSGWSCLTNLTMNCLFLLAVLRMVEDGVPPVQIGLVETASAIAGVVGALLAPRLIAHLPTGWLTIAIAWSPLPLAVPLALWPHPAVVAAALAGVLALNPAGNAGMASYRLTVTPPELVGRLQATTQFVSMTPMPLAPVLAGLLLHRFGGLHGTLIAAAACGVTALIPTLSRRVRAVPRPRHWVSAAASAGDAVEDAQDAGPGRGVGVDDDEVVTVDAHELGGRAGSGRGSDVGLGLADRHDGVVVAVHAPDGHVDRQHRDRVDVAVGGTVGVPEERLDGAVTEVLR